MVAANAELAQLAGAMMTFSDLMILLRTDGKLRRALQESVRGVIAGEVYWPPGRQVISLLPRHRLAEPPRPTAPAPAAPSPQPAPQVPEPPQPPAGNLAHGPLELSAGDLADLATRRELHAAELERPTADELRDLVAGSPELRAIGQRIATASALQAGGTVAQSRPAPRDDLGLSHADVQRLVTQRLVARGCAAAPSAAPAARSAELGPVAPVAQPVAPSAQPGAAAALHGAPVSAAAVPQARRRGLL